MIGHGGLDYFQDHPSLGQNFENEVGQVDHFFSALSLIRNGPESIVGMSIPSWSHFSKSK